MLLKGSLERNLNLLISLYSHHPCFSQCNNIVRRIKMWSFSPFSCWLWICSRRLSSAVCPSLLLALHVSRSSATSAEPKETPPPTVVCVLERQAVHTKQLLSIHTQTSVVKTKTGGYKLSVKLRRKRPSSLSDSAAFSYRYFGGSQFSGIATSGS